MPKKLLDDEDRPKSERDRDHERDRSEREPISWRDRDRKKDRSAHTSPDPRDQQAPLSPHNRFLAERERKSNLSTANALFANNPRDTLEKKILSASSDDVGPLIDQYLQQFGSPESFQVLSRFAEHPSGEVVKTALEQLEPMMAAATPADRQKLLQSLKLVSMMGRDANARKAASSFIRRNAVTNVSS